MSYVAVVEGLHERFRTIEGLLVLDGEPVAVQRGALIYTIFADLRRQQAGQVTAMTYISIHRLCIQWQDPAQAERQLRMFVNAIPAVVDEDPQLGGRIRSGLARVTEGPSGWATIAGTKWRIIDFQSEVLDKAPFRSGI